MFSIGFNPVTERWIIWNDNLCKAVNGQSYDTEADAISALRAYESRVFSHSRDSYYRNVLCASH